MVIDFDILAF